MTYTAMILLILAILGGLIGFGNDDMLVAFIAQAVAFTAGGLWGVLVIGTQLRRLFVAQGGDHLSRQSRFPAKNPRQRI